MDPDSSNVSGVAEADPHPTFGRRRRSSILDPAFWMPFARGGPSRVVVGGRMALIVVDLSKQRRAKSQV